MSGVVSGAATTRPARTGMMPLGVAHEIGMLLSSTSALLIVLLGGAYAPWAWATALGPLLAFLLAQRGVAAPLLSGTLIGGGAIAAGIGIVVRLGPDGAVPGAAAALMGLLLARLITRTQLQHDLQTLLLSLLLVLAGSVLNVGINYIVVFVVYAVTTVWALSTRLLLQGAQGAGGLSRTAARARDDVVGALFFVATGAVSVVVMLSAVVVFAAFPRIGFGELSFLAGKGDRIPTQVGLSGDPRGLSSSSEVVARVRGVPIEAFDAGLYLRGIVYDELSTTSFGQSAPDTANAPVIDARPRVALASTSKTRRYDITLMPFAGSLLFTLGDTLAARVDGGGANNPNRSIAIAGRNRHDELKMSAPLRSPLRYEVRGTIAAPGTFLPRDDHPLLDDEARWLRVPPTLDPRVADLARRVVAGRTARPDVVAALRAHLLTQYRYSLEPLAQQKAEPLLAFLFDDKAGHCELFATAFALLLRTQGIPARVIGGYQGGAWSEGDDLQGDVVQGDGNAVVVFQQRHAHAWVEWWMPGAGWVVDDATPTAGAPREQLRGVASVVEALRRFWDDRVVDYSLQDQTEALRAIGTLLRGNGPRIVFGGAIALLVVVVVVGWLARRWRRRGRRAHDARFARALQQAIERIGGAAVGDAQTLREAAQQAGAHDVVHEALDAYEQMRFGGRPLSVREQDAWIARLSTVRGPTTTPVRDDA